MLKLPLALSLLLCFTVLLGQNPHGMSFEVDCSPCHTTAGWKLDKNMTFNHDTQCHLAGSGGWLGGNIEHSFFPLTQGHAINCIDCQEHNKAEMDNKHLGRDNYAYSSVACYTCHPRGNS